MRFASMCKLTEDQVREIRRSRVRSKSRGLQPRQEGSIRSLAERFGVTDQVIVRVCRGHAYKDVR